MAPDQDGDPGLERQRAGIEDAFRHGWRSPDDGLPRVLTEQAYAQARRLLGRGGWTGLDRATVQARTEPAADDAGIIWTTWGNPVGPGS